MPSKDRRYVVPVKAAARKAEKIAEDDVVKVQLTVEV
jgi:hypothetical protein